MRFFLRRFCCCCLAHTLWTIPWSAQSSFQSDPASFVPRCCFFFSRDAGDARWCAALSVYIYIISIWLCTARKRGRTPSSPSATQRVIYIIYTSSSCSLAFLFFFFSSGLNYSSNKSACTSFSRFPLSLLQPPSPSSLLYVYDAAMLDKAGQQKADCRSVGLINDGSERC